MRKSWALDKDPSEYLIEYAERFGKEQYEKEIPCLLWDILTIVGDVRNCLVQNKTLSELYPSKYPMKIEEGADI